MTDYLSPNLQASTPQGRGSIIHEHQPGVFPEGWVGGVRRWRVVKAKDGVTTSRTDVKPLQGFGRCTTAGQGIPAGGLPDVAIRTDSGSPRRPTIQIERTVR